MSETKNLYSNLKFLRFPDRLEALEERRIAAPVHIRIKPINACNHDCWYCAYHVDWLQLGKLMEYKDVIPRNKMIEILNDIVAMGVKAVTFTGGGEPLMYPSIVESMELLAAGQVKVGVITNGSNLKGKIARACAGNCVWVRISIDAWDGPSYAKSRKIKENEFDKVVKNMRDFVALGSPCVLGISFIIDHDNCEHIYEFSRLMKETGVNHVKMSGCVVSNDGKENNAYHEKIKAVVKDQIERAKTLSDANFAVIDRYHEMEERFEKSYTLCPFLQFLTVIGADCKVYTCQDKAYTKEGCLGSIETVSFKEFWFSDENVRNIYSLDPSVTCRHHCVAHEKNKAILSYLEVDREHGSFV